MPNSSPSVRFGRLRAYARSSCARSSRRVPGRTAPRARGRRSRSRRRGTSCRPRTTRCTSRRRGITNVSPIAEPLSFSSTANVVTTTASRPVTTLVTSPTNTASTREYTSHGGGVRAQLHASAGRAENRTTAQTSAASANAASFITGLYVFIREHRSRADSPSNPRRRAPVRSVVDARPDQLQHLPVRARGRRFSSGSACRAPRVFLRLTRSRLPAAVRPCSSSGTPRCRRTSCAP